MCVCDSGFSDDGNGNCVDKSGKILYATGVELNVGVTAKCQIVDMNDPSQSCQCPDYGAEVNWATGGIVQGKPIICGGRMGDETQNTCFQLVPSPTGSQWISATSMNTGRDNAAGVPFTPVNSDTEVLWVIFHG